eukprot:1321218-Amorphochlora_amoeboformis.AAC.1
MPIGIQRSRKMGFHGRNSGLEPKIGIQDRNPRTESKKFRTRSEACGRKEMRISKGLGALGLDLGWFNVRVRPG